MAQTPGTYFGVLTEVGLDTNKNGTPYMYLTFLMTHFQVDADWTETPQPFRRDVRLYLSDAAWPYTEETLRKLGFNGDWNQPRLRDDLYDPGSEIICTTRKGDDNKVYNDWNLPGMQFADGEKERKPPPREEIRTFKARWDTGQAAARKPSGSPGIPPPRAAMPSANGMPPAPPDDDIPF